MNLTPHFSLDELTFSEAAVRLGIDNTPDADVLSNLGVLAEGLERVRAVLGHPVRISSGYRCPALNAAIGGSKTSQHMQGLAADFACPGVGSPRDVAMEIVLAADSIDYDMVIHEGAWIHISFSGAPRREVLTAHFANGGVSYSKGLT